jgi:predicted transcriptional regulator
MKALSKRAYKIKGLDPENLSVSDVILLLGIYYNGALRVIHELEEAGKIEVRYEKGQIRLTSEGLEAIRAELERRQALKSARYQEAPTRGQWLVEARQLAAAAKELHLRARRLRDSLETPGATSAWIGSVPVQGVRLKAQIPVIVEVEPNGKDFRAAACDLGLDALGGTRKEAVRALRECIGADYLYLRAKERSAEGERRLEELLRYIEEKAEDRPQETARPTGPLE